MRNIVSEIKAELQKIKPGSENPIYNVCKEIWEFIQKHPKEQQGSYFSAFLSDIYFDTFLIELSHSSSDELKCELPKDIPQLANRIIDNLVQKRLPEEDFYHALYEKMLDSSFLPDLNAQVSFLTSLWISPRIPYYQVEQGCTMDDDQFASINQRIEPYLRKAFFILSINIKQRTQRASLLMQLADQIKNEEERVVFWAVIMANIRGKSERRDTEEKQVVVPSDDSK